MVKNAFFFLVVYLFISLISVLPTYAQLSDPISLATNVRNHNDFPRSGFYEFSSDGKYVVYIADDDEDGIPDLFSVPVNGGPAVNLSEGLVNEGGLSSFKITPDGKTVLFTVSQIVDYNLLILHSVSIQGGQRKQLVNSINSGPDSFSILERYFVTQDSKNVVFQGFEIVQIDETFDFVFDSYVSVIPINGGTATRLSGELLEQGGDVESFQLSADGQHVVYRADHAGDENYELFSVPIGGGAAVNLNRELVPNGNVFDFKISPDSNTVVYQADAIFNDVKEIFKVPITGGDSIKVNTDIGLNLNVSNFKFSADSQYIVYSTNFLGQTEFALFSVKLNSNTVVQLNEGTSLNIPSEYTNTFVVSPDSQRVVFTRDGGNERTGLYSVMLDGSKLTRLNSAPGATTYLVSFSKVWSDSKTVSFRGRSDATVGYNLFRVPIEGGTPEQINPDLNDGSIVIHIISNNGEVLYTASSNGSDVWELYYVSAEGNSAVKVNQPLQPNKRIFLGLFGENKDYIFYKIDDDSAQYQSELFSVKLMPDDEMCFPIKSANNKIAVVCL